MAEAVVAYLGSDAFRTHLENAYWMAGILMGVGVSLAAWQVRLASNQLSQARESFRLSCQRESYRIAAERCDYFGQHILPLCHRVEEAFKAKGITLLDKSKVTIDGGVIKFDGRGIDNADLPKVNALSLELSTLLNAVEGWAVFFVARVADEKIGYLTCGHAFVQLFERFLPVYIISNSLKDHNKHSQNLFFSWHERIHQERLIKKTSELVAQVDMSKLKIQKPLGA